MDLAPPAPQHLRALKEANRVRMARASLKRRVAGGEVSVAEVVAECPDEARSMTVGELLLSQRRWGHTRCRRLLSQLPMTETKTVGSLTERQRSILARLLAGDHVDDPWGVDRRSAVGYAGAMSTTR